MTPQIKGFLVGVATVVVIMFLSGAAKPKEAIMSAREKQLYDVCLLSGKRGEISCKAFIRLMTPGQYDEK